MESSHGRILPKVFRMKCKLDFLDEDSGRLTCFTDDSHILPESAESIDDIVGESIYSRSIGLDLSNVEAIKSEDIAWLITCYRRCSEGGGKVTLHSVPGLTRKSLNLMKIDDLIRIAPTANDL